MRTNIIYIALNYKRTLYIGVAYTNYLTSSLNIFIDKTLVSSSSALFTYLLRNIPIIPYIRLPISTDLATRDRLRDGNLTIIYGNLTAICRILLYSAKSTEFYQVLLGPLPETYSALCTY